jgi:hypothetical protein
VLCFSYILGYSRRHYIDFTIDRKFFTLIRRHQDAFAHFEGVPKTCLYDGEKTVILRWEAGQPVYNPDLKTIAQHERKPVGAGEKLEDPSHRKSEKVRYGLEPVKEAFLSLGDAADEFLQGLKQRHPHHCGFQARCILRLKEHYHCRDIHAALVHAIKYYAFEAKTIQRILKARFTPRPLEAMSARSASQCFSLLPEIKQRPLEAYSALFKETSNV